MSFQNFLCRHFSLVLFQIMSTPFMMKKISKIKMIQNPSHSFSFDDKKKKEKGEKWKLEENEKSFPSCREATTTQWKEEKRKKEHESFYVEEKVMIFLELGKFLIQSLNSHLATLVSIFNLI